MTAGELLFLSRGYLGAIVQRRAKRGLGGSWTVTHDAAPGSALVYPQAAQGREAGVATEMLLTKAERVSGAGKCAAGLRPLRSRRACRRFA